MAGHGGGDGSRAAASILVLDAQDRPALAAIRCLRQNGYRVGATANTPIGPGLWSRDCAGRAVLPDASANVDAFTARLVDVLRQDHYDVMLPGTDETLYLASLRREQLAPHVTIGLPDQAIVRRALDKVCLADEAATVGLAPPEGRVCDGLRDALLAARAFGYPVLVKGVRTIDQTDVRLVRHPSRLVADESELREVQPSFGTCIVQRRVAGNLMSFSGVATESGLLASVAARYRRTWPPRAGQASFLETITLPGALAEQVGALVAGIGWTGLFQLQLIERDDGPPMAIDFNPRLYGSMSVAAAAGVPLATLWVSWLLGRRPEPVTAVPGIHYRMEDADARHILWKLRRSDYRGAARAALPVARTTHAYFRVRDPLPLAARGVELIQARWRHRGTRGASVA